MGHAGRAVATFTRPDRTKATASSVETAPALPPLFDFKLAPVSEKINFFTDI